MGTVSLKVVLAFFLMAKSGHSKSLPYIKGGLEYEPNFPGNSMAYPDLTILEMESSMGGDSNAYGGDKNYLDYVNFYEYGDPNNVGFQPDIIDDFEADPNFYPDYDSYSYVAETDLNEDKTEEDTGDDYKGDPAYYPDYDSYDTDDDTSLAEEETQEKDIEDDYKDDPNYYPDYDEEEVEEKEDTISYEDQTDDLETGDDYKDDPNYYPDYDEVEEEEEEGDAISYEDQTDDKDAGDDYKDDPNYYPDYDEEEEEEEVDAISYEDQTDDKDTGDDYKDDPNYYPDYDEEEDADSYEDQTHDKDTGDDYKDDPNYYPDYNEEEDAADSYEDQKDDKDKEDEYKDDPNYYPDYEEEEDDIYSYEDQTDDNDAPHDNDDDPDYYPNYEYEDEESHDDDPDYIPEADSLENHIDEYSVKGKRQFKSGQFQQQYGHVVYNADGYNQWEPEIHQLDNEISIGVEPLPPVQVEDISKGVEPVVLEDTDENDFLSWVGEGWGHLVNTAGKVGDHIEDSFDTVGDQVSGVAGTIGDKVSGAFDTIGDKVSVAVDKIQDVASDAADSVHDAAHSAGSTIVDAYYSLKNSLPDLRERIHHLFSNFGLMVQRGADYCIQHLQHTTNQVREAQILDKLQQKLKDGNEHVIAFFTVLGEKVTSWAQSHGHLDIDEGLIIVDSHRPQEGTHGEHAQEGGIAVDEELILNLFQDQDVLDQMNNMVNQGILTQEELDIYQQTQQVSGPQLQDQHDQAIQVQSHSRRRHLRSRITAAV